MKPGLPLDSGEFIPAEELNRKKIMNTKDEALKLALGELQAGKVGNAMQIIREALAEQPAQQPRSDYRDWDYQDLQGEQPQQEQELVGCFKVEYEYPTAQQQEPVSIKSVAQKAGFSLPETYIPTMDDAIAAGDSVLMNEQAALLRECRAALDSLIAQKPTLAGLLCGSTTLGNLKAELGAYRPQGVFGTSPQPAQQQEPVAWMIWTHGPVNVFMNKDEANMEFDRLNHAYPEPTRMLAPLYTSPPASKPEDK